jgi:hypothetical protein
MIGATVEVAVSEGNAVIGTPAGEGRTEGPLVLAGSIGTFSASVDPASITKDPSRASSLVEDALAMRKSADPQLAAKEPSVPTLPPTVVTPPASPKTVEPPLPAPTVPEVATTAPVAPPSGLTSAQLEGPLALVDTEVKKCLPDVLPGGVSFTADLTFTVSPEGKVVDPKLDTIQPERRECVRVALGKVTFPTAAASTTVDRKIVRTGN